MTPFKFSAALRPLLQIAALCAIGIPCLLSGQPAPAQAPAPAQFPNAAPNLKDDLQGPFLLVDESPIQVIKILEALTGQTAIQSAAIPDAKINFASEIKITRDEAVRALKSVLAMNGIAITPMGEKFFRAAPSQTGVNAQAPSFIFGSATDFPPSQQFYSKLYELKYLDIENFEKTLTDFASPAPVSTVVMFPRQNAFLITDTLVNIQRIEMLLTQIDRPVSITEDIGFIQLKNTSAEELKRKIQTLKNESLKKYFEKTSIEADERTNQVMIVTTKGNLQPIREMIEKLDIDSEPMTRSEVFYIKHGEAITLGPILEKIVQSQQDAQKKSQNDKAAEVAATNRTNRDVNFQNRNNPNAQRLPTNLTPDSAGIAGLQFSDFITIVADERSNAIVVYGTASDIKQIGGIIDKIDILLNQVKIDVIITEVSLKANQVSGLSTFGLDYTTITTDGQKGWSGKTSMWNLSDTDGSPFSISASEYGFSAVFNVAEKNDSVKILSSPSIVTTHNKKATFTVSQKYPLITASTAYSNTDDGTTRSTVEWKDIGITLTVTPKIGDNGMVQMEIKQTVSTVVGTIKLDNNEQPIIGNREAESYVSAKSGETVILGGLQQTNDSDSDGAVWLLSDIPIIGNLFKPASDKHERTELIIFIRPTLVNSLSENDFITQQGLKNSIVGKDVERFFRTGKFQDPEKNPLEFEQSSFWRTVLPLENGENKMFMQNGENAKAETDGQNPPSRPAKARPGPRIRK